MNQVDLPILAVLSLNRAPNLLSRPIRVNCYLMLPVPQLISAIQQICLYLKTTTSIAINISTWHGHR